MLTGRAYIAAADPETGPRGCDALKPLDRSGIG